MPPNSEEVPCFDTCACQQVNYFQIIWVYPDKMATCAGRSLGTLRKTFCNGCRYTGAIPRRKKSICGLINIPFSPKMTMGHFSHLAVKVMFLGGFPNLLTPCKGPFGQPPETQPADQPLLRGAVLQPLRSGQELRVGC